ncbi:MAG TPA: type II toxin-antitoxin system CcdA family antitoxin [Methanospirillum sp.]|nr:type II toxin-antitoxin system CcdA family antitoxin [Methanospirillum sp.]
MIRIPTIYQRPDGEYVPVTVAVPKDMRDEAKRNQINLSALFTRALKAELGKIAV